MRFRYIGDPNDDGNGPSELTLFGYRFGLNGSAVEVDDKHAIVKLKSNGHFEAAVGRPPADKRLKPNKAKVGKAGTTAEPADGDEG